MQVWLLGTLEVSHADSPVVVRGALPRRLLALLALTPGREVGTDQLLHSMWGDTPSDGALATLHSHVARLRRDLPARSLLRRGYQGYALDLAPEDVDAVVFEQQVARGTTYLSEARVTEASAAFADALRLWRGTPYAEFGDCEPLAIEADRLATLRLDALEGRISADLARADLTPPVAELEALVHWHPTRESFWALLMCAQYRLGRQGDALATYQRARTTLADELGVDPGIELERVQEMVLAHDPALGAPLPASLLYARHPAGSYPAHVVLVERDHQCRGLTALHDEARDGSGRVALVHGEAGAGKTALVREWAAATVPRERLLWGGCDPLTSPRPLGPLLDIAPHLDAGVGQLLASGERDGLFEAFLASVERVAPVVVVVEDLHWADSSTLDLVRFLSRRLERVPALVVVTYRDDHLVSSDPLRVMLGDIASSPVVRRIPVPLLSPDAVAELAAGTTIDAAALHQETGGNAFFVSEVIAAGGEQLPGSVQDAVLARVHRLSPQARQTLESAAVIGSRIEPGLLRTMPGATAESADECVISGMLRFVAPSYEFRHEIVRQSVLSGITPGRLGALHWQALERLRELPVHPRPYARLAEHAEIAGDGPALLEFAVAAGDRAASLGSHREAAFQYGRALPHAGLLSREERLTLLRKRAMECFLTDEQHESIEAWQQVIAMLREEDRPYELADALTRCYRSFTTIGDHVHSPPLIDEALAAVRDLPPSAELSTALAMHAMSLPIGDVAVAEGERAVAIARALDDPHVLAYTLNSHATTLAFTDPDAGLELMRESLQVALTHDLDDDTGRAYNNLTWILLSARRFDGTLAVVDEGMRYCDDHDLNGSYLCLLAARVSLLMDLGEWAEAEEAAKELLYVRVTNRASRMEPLCALGLLAARRGDFETAWPLLDEARDHVRNAQIVEYDGFIAQSRGEVHLLEGDLDAVDSAVRPVYDRAVAEGVEQQDYITSLSLLLWRAGRLDEPPSTALEPARLSIMGEPRAAFTAWMKDGFTYQAAWALLDSDDELDLREARAMFERLDAPVLVARVDAKLRSIGAKVPRGPRTSTRTNLGGLTDRELEVLDLLDAGLRNADIAERLCLSEKTVGHHVSAILTKLGASSRLEAVRRARDLTATG